MNSISLALVVHQYFFKLYGIKAWNNVMKKFWGVQNCAQSQGFHHFLKFASLVFLDIAQDCSLGQCLKSSRAETLKNKKYSNFCNFFSSFLHFSLNNLLQIHLKLLTKKGIQKTAEATGDQIGNKIGDKITKILRNLPQNTCQAVESETKKQGFMEKYQQKDIYLQRKGSKLLMI